MKVQSRDWTTLCENDPGQADYRRWLVEAFIDRGELNHMNGRTIDAEKDFQAAIGHADKLRSPSISPAYRRAMASALINLSEILVLKNQHAEAQNAADRAVELLEPLARPRREIRLYDQRSMAPRHGSHGSGHCLQRRRRSRPRYPGFRRGGAGRGVGCRGRRCL